MISRGYFLLSRWEESLVKSQVVIVGLMILINERKRGVLTVGSNPHNMQHISGLFLLSCWKKPSTGEAFSFSST